MTEEPLEKRWDVDLTGAALRVASADRSPLRVTAGPGTGKSYALMRRVARRLQEGNPPDRILAVTFTRTAAKDLERELGKLGVRGCERVIVGTLHSRCFAILAQADVLELTGRRPRPLVKFEERFLLEDLDKTRFGNYSARVKRVAAFNAAWARLQSDQPGWPPDAVDMEFAQVLLNWLVFHRTMLIGELVPVTLRYLRDNPRSAHRRAYEHVFVDEYQDLNRAEQVLIELLAEGANYTVLGDEDQSIYTTMKFAHPEGIREFAAAQDEPLEECRRCPTSVIDLANELISHNQDRAKRKLKAAQGQPVGEVQIVQWGSMKEEAQGLADFIRDRIESGRVEAGRVLVLCPRRKFGYLIRDALQENGIAAHSFFQEEVLDGNPKRADDNQALKAFTLLNLLAERTDRVALRCWLGFDIDDLRSSAWAKLRAHCEATQDEPWDALLRLHAGTLNLAGVGLLVSRFSDLRDRLAVLGPLTTQQLVDSLFPPKEEWANQLRRVVENFDMESITQVQLRDQLRTVITQPELPTDVEYVRIMSLHKSKGLTAGLVVISGCVEGLIPTVDKKVSKEEQNAQLREQRRLFYVAITRTTDTLVISSVSRLPTDQAHQMRATVPRRGKTVPAVASTFIDELGPMAPRSRNGRELNRKRSAG